MSDEPLVFPSVPDFYLMHLPQGLKVPATHIGPCIKMHLSGATRIRVLVIFACIVIFWLLIKQFMENRRTIDVEEIVIKPSGVPVVVGVYYEALCPDSKHFVVKQLKTTHDLAPQLIDIVFIPYGKATTHVLPDGSLKFNCQHGQVECEANIIHACVVDVIGDPDLRLKMVTCMIRDNIVPKDAFHRCAKENSVESAEKIQKCYSGPHGAELLKTARRENKCPEAENGICPHCHPGRRAVQTGTDPEKPLQGSLQNLIWTRSCTRCLCRRKSHRLAHCSMHFFRGN
uniref:Uncharacterized protein n=1 Tax=Phlebotomus papatasi TaxID=29031 RepID=A0A1B0D7W8_PHLPP